MGIVTHDARTIRYPDPLVKVNDTVKVDIASGKIEDFIKFDSGNLCMITGGRNLGRVGVVTHRERHPGSFDIVHIRDAIGHIFATRLGNDSSLASLTKPGCLYLVVKESVSLLLKNVIEELLRNKILEELKTYLI